MGNLREDSSLDSSSLSLGGSENREPGARKCLRRGCENHYTPRRWNQQFCGHPECQVLVRRWQAAKRQRRVRQTADGRQRHRDRERQRRDIDRQNGSNAASTEPASEATQSSTNRAWSRCRRYPENFCDRPGCYDPVRASRSKAAKYCSDGCRRAVHRVRDRERKWLKRHALAKQILRATHGCRQSRMPINQLPNFGIHEPASMQPPPSDQFFNYGNPGNSDLSSETIQRRKTDGYQRDSGSKSRAPPAAE